MIRDHLVPRIEANLTMARATVINKGIVRYVDKNSDILMKMNWSERYSFADQDRALIYDNIGIDERTFQEEIRESKQIYSGNKIQSNPFYCSVMLTAHVLLEQKNEKLAQLIMTYMCMQMYTSAHKGFFKYGVNDKIMNYTIAHLDNSFRVRSVPSLFAWIDDNAEQTFNAYKDRIERCDDADISWVVNAMWDRIKGKLRKIANLYYKNHEAGNYLNEDDDQTQDSENYHEADNNSYMVERLANKVYIKLLNHQVDERFFKYAITRSDTSLQKLKNLTYDIIDSDNGNLLKSYLISNIEYFLIMSGRGFEYIPRGEYIAYMKAAYASNTELKQMVSIKDQLEKWLTEHMTVVGRQNYGKTARLGYKKALYMFFNFIINREAKLS